MTKHLFKIGSKIAKVHSKEKPEERILPGGTRLVPVKAGPGLWVFRKEREDVNN